MEDRTRTIGARIDTARAVAGLSKTELAARLGKPIAMVSKWISGSKEPSPASLRLLADVLGISIDDLLGCAEGEASARRGGDTGLTAAVADGAPETMGQRIAVLRASRGMTKAELARAVGKAWRNVHAWEADEKGPDLESVASLATALGVSMEAIVGTAAPSAVAAAPPDHAMARNVAALRHALVKAGVAAAMVDTVADAEVVALAVAFVAASSRRAR